MMPQMGPATHDAPRYSQVVTAFPRFLLLFASIAYAGNGWADRYALILSAEPASKRAAAIQQAALRSMLREKGFAVTGSTDTLLSAVFVSAQASQIEELRALPGVAQVIRMPKLKRTLNQALDLVNARPAWATAGGASKAGAGVKIAILDSGIDETHPGLRDSTLAMPAGFPKAGSSDDASHTTTKVIAARNFISSLAIGDGTPETTLPDDLSVRDRVGHGTAVAMIAAGVEHTSPLGTIAGAAPKAYLGNYKIFGSPGVLDITTGDIVLQALDAAFRDGMDVALLPVGFPATWYPSDSGSLCGKASGAPCDPWVAAVSNATIGGMAIVVPAGNDGDNGPNSINTPGDAPGVITVGASTNKHTVSHSVSTPSGDRLAARLSDGPQLVGPLSARLIDVTTLDSTGLACTALPASSLAGSIVLITRGTCTFGTKTLNAANAGAVAVLFSREPGGTSLFEATGLANTPIPSALVSADSGTFLKNYLASNPGTAVTLLPEILEKSTSDPEAVASFSSIGPNFANFGIKPELVAPGDGIYTAAQNYDPNGDLYNPTRYTAVNGTSFSAALVAGAVALVKQAHPGYSVPQLKSAVTNTASTGLVDFDGNNQTVPARSIAVGAGKLNMNAAIQSTVTIEPSTIGFGAVNQGVAPRTLTISNTGSTAVNLTLNFEQRDADSRARVNLPVSTLSLQPGAFQSITVTLTGNVPTAGLYEGVLNVTGGAVPLRVPYMYIVTDGAPASIAPLFGDNFVTEAGTAVDIGFKVLDNFGLPVANLPVRFAPSGSVNAATPATDAAGIGEAYIYTSATIGDQTFAGTTSAGGGISWVGRVRPLPNLTSGGIVNAASFQSSAGFAPGSYITLFGTGLAEGTIVERTPYLPVSLGGASVSFDSADVHVPGRLFFVSSGQISVQIPWELLGQTLAVVKVTLSNSASLNANAGNNKLGTNQTLTATIPIAPVSPAFFEYNSSGQTLAAALDEANRLVSTSNPVAKGKVLQFFVNGLGDVLDGTRPGSGELTPATLPLASTRVQPTVTIGGQAAQVLFSGLAPLNVGLYQVNVLVPQRVNSGLQPAVLTIGGVVSKTTTVPVQ